MSLKVSGEQSPVVNCESQLNLSVKITLLSVLNELSHKRHRNTYNDRPWDRIKLTEAGCYCQQVLRRDLDSSLISQTIRDCRQSLKKNLAIVNDQHQVNLT